MGGGCEPCLTFDPAVNAGSVSTVGPAVARAAGDLRCEKELLVFRHAGSPGHFAARLLALHGFRVRNLSGGCKRYQIWKGEFPVPLPAEGEIREE